jgi:hypothetical protein
MPNRVWPIDAVGGAPAYSGRSLRQSLMAPLAAGATSTRPFGTRSGVRPGTPASTVSATSTTWTVRPHAGLLDLEAAAEAGVYGYALDLTTGTVTAADSNNPRIDILYVQLDDPAEADGSTTPNVTARYLAGSPAATPSAPEPPVSRALVLGTINVPKLGGGAPTTTFTAPLAVAAGGITPVRNIADRATLAGYATALSPVFVHRADAPIGARLEVCDDGANWRQHGFEPNVDVAMRAANADVGRGVWHVLAGLTNPFQFVKDGWYEINGTGQANIQGAAGTLVQRLRAFNLASSPERGMPGGADTVLNLEQAFTFKSTLTAAVLVAHEVFLPATGSTAGIRCYLGSQVSVKRVG